MLLTVTTTSDDPASPATDLGHLLHKHPDRAQQIDVAGGRAHVFYPEADERRCTAALLLEVDPVALARRRRGDEAWLGQHVNDRPYAATSMLAVALGKAFRTALGGRCDARPDLVGRPVPLEVRVPTMPSDGDPGLVRRLFEPLGWQVDARSLPLDETVPAWGPSRFVDLTLRGEQVLSRALAHLYVLVPVLDGAKHYWVSDDEVEKLLRAGEGWLPDHPERDLVTRRYLKHQRHLVLGATERLAALDDDVVEDVADDPAEGSADEDTRPLQARRADAVLDVLRTEQARRVVDAGCGEGRLLRLLVRDPAFTEVVGLDVSARALEVAERRLGLDRLPDSQRDKLRLAQSSLTYRDDRFAGYDAVVLMEVVEHVDADRLPALEAQLFSGLAPRVVVLTTPNAEHNVRFDSLAAGAFRHPDHRFEWSRAELAAWADAVAARHGYAVRYDGVGDDDPEVGPPTQVAVFTRPEPATGAA